MTSEQLILSYVVVLLGGLAGVAVYYNHRTKYFEPTRSEDHVFRCEQCSYVYTDDADVDLSRCPQCGTMNHRFVF